MTNNYDQFIEAVNAALSNLNEPTLYERDHNTIVHSFGYGKTPQQAVENVIHNRNN